MRTYKRIAAVALGATFAVLAFAAPALATWGDSTYSNWNVVEGLYGNPSSADTNSPHRGYDATTVKCGVCHAVHSAKASGQALLADTKASSCLYCHVDSATAYGTPMYGGVRNNYLIDTKYNHSAQHGATCDSCHQVHAAVDKMTSHSYLTDKLLKGAKTQDPFEPAYDPDVAAAPLTDPNEEAISKWCTLCHMGMYSYYDLDGVKNDTHILSANLTQTVDGTPIKVAWANSTNCSSCHSSQRAVEGRWPHYTEGARFLEKAASASDTATRVLDTETKVDGVCLKCHRDGTLGVGKSY